MSGNSRRAAYNEQIQDEATEWFVRFCEQEVDGPSCHEFDAWLRRSPEHIRAYLDISALWDAAGSMTRNRRIDIEAMVRRARAESNVVVLDQSGNSKAGAIHKPRARGLRVAIAAAVLLFCLACGEGGLDGRLD